MKILIEYTPDELRALIDSDFMSLHYHKAVERAERALEVEEGSGGDLAPQRDTEAADRV